MDDIKIYSNAVGAMSTVKAELTEYATRSEDKHLIDLARKLKDFPSADRLKVTMEADEPKFERIDKFMSQYVNVFIDYYSLASIITYMVLKSGVRNSDSILAFRRPDNLLPPIDLRRELIDKIT